MRKNKKTKHVKKGTGHQLTFANIKVVGIGGGGGNAVDRMSRDFIRGVDFIAINTDHQDLDHCRVRHKIYIGRNLTRGLGTGMNPDLGRQAAEENKSEIAESLRGADLVFIAAGLGGGTGGGASPIVAEVAKQNGALTVAVVTKPFSFEGSQRDRVAREALVKLKDKVDAIIAVPNDRIFSVISKDTPIIKAFEAIDDVLKGALRGIVEIIASPGIINLDFADVKSVIQDAGVAIIGIGLASGQERAATAVNLAMNSPLLEASAEGAKSVLLGISGGRDMKMNEVNEAAKIVAQAVDPGARIIFGAYHDRNLKPNQIKITLVAAGFNGNQPSSLFSGHFTEKRQSGVGSVVVVEGAHDKERKAEVFDAKRVPPFSPRPEAFSEQAGDKRKAESVAEKTEGDKNKDKKESDKSDIWDIPTFLRKKRK